MDRTCLRAFYSKIDRALLVECDECGDSIEVHNADDVLDVKEAIASGDFDDHPCVSKVWE